MTPKDFEAALKALSKLAASLDAQTIAHDLAKLAAVLGKSRDKTAASALKKISPLRGANNRSDQNDIEPIIKVLETSLVVAELTAKATFAKLLTALLSILKANKDVALDDLILTIQASYDKAASDPSKTTIIRTDVIQRYVKQLEECLGDESFHHAFNTLKQDAEVSPAEMASIAKAFTSKKPKSRVKSLDVIWAKHHTLMVFRSKSKSRAGRSAA